MDDFQQYIMEKAESLLIELACDLGIDQDVFEDQMQVIIALMQNVEQKKSLKVSLEARHEDYANPNRYLEMIHFIDCTL